MTEISEMDFHALWGVQHAADGGLMQFDEIRTSAPDRVWTVVESGDEADGNWYAIPGIHPINRLGYVLTATSWTTDTPQAIYFLDDEDEHLD
jgi:hypothetical protein